MNIQAKLIHISGRFVFHFTIFLTGSSIISIVIILEWHSQSLESVEGSKDKGDGKGAFQPQDLELIMYSQSNSGNMTKAGQKL